MGSMHLVRGLYNTKSRKPKNSKVPQDRLAVLRIEWKKYNKLMKQSRLHSKVIKKFDDYVLYTQGKYKPEEAKRKRQTITEKFDQTKHIAKSHGDQIGGMGAAKEKNTYTGDLIVGIATMHKSNLVPVMRGTKQAEEFAKMRR